MPVTFKVAKHSAEPVHPQSLDRVQDAKDLLTRARLSPRGRCIEVFQSSVCPEALPSMEYCGNGFVHAAMRAHGGHHNLVIRPDDVWIAILNQFSFYVNAHAEELRGQFVEHGGKKTVRVVAEGNRYMVDFGEMTRQMAEQLRENVVDKTLTEWILPDFTTTTTADTTICSALMMTTLKSYFDYMMACVCGIPSVTLEGEKEDWLKLLQRVDKLDEFGRQPRAWATMLRPILRRFVSAFDGEPDVEFWTHVVQLHDWLYKADFISGWITAFVPWTDEGVWQAGIEPLRAAPWERDGLAAGERLYSVDGVTYPKLSVDDITQGYCETDVLLYDNGLWIDCLMVAGNIAMSFRSADEKAAEAGYDTVSPAPHWFLFTTREPTLYRPGVYESQPSALPRPAASWWGSCIVL